MTSAWRDDILCDVTSVPLIGCPGSFVISGDSALPILTGSKPNDILIAAGEVGRGRVVAFSHDGYINAFIESKPEFEQLRSNVIKWVSRDEYHEIARLGEIDFALHKNKVIICKEGMNGMVDGMVEFICSGGGIICGMCPWGWLQLNPGKSLTDMPINKLFDLFGMTFTDGYSSQNKAYKVSENKAHYAHVGQALERITEDIQMLDHYADILVDMDGIKGPTTSILQKIYHFVTLHVTSIKECIPRRNNPVQNSKSKALLKLYTLQLKQTNSKAMGVEVFPGDLGSYTYSEKTNVRISCQHPAIHPTGYYAPAGKEIAVNILRDDDQNQGAWSVCIGCHRDNLTNCSEWRRWPDVVVEKSLDNQSITLSSPFGGLIYLRSHKETHSHSVIDVELHNAVPAPHFDLKDPESVHNWKVRRDAPGLWADLSGEFITITLPSSSIREIDDPSEVMRLWDKVVLAHHNLRGTSATGRRREWVVTDEQPVAGYMHAGYPIVTHLDITDPKHARFILSKNALLKPTGEGHWGLFHELGHNMQRSAWTFDGTVEVTCNIFTLHAMEVVSHVNPWIHPWLRNQLNDIKKYLNDNADFSKWKQSPGVALAIYTQLVHHFGWESYKKVLRVYEETDQRLDTNRDKIDAWVNHFSEVVGHNLCPLFDFWGISVTERCRSRLNQLSLFFPHDEFTAMAPNRAKHFFR